MKKKQISDEALEHTRKYIAELAKTHGISEEEIRNEMEEAMLAGMANPDPAVQARWASIQWRGDKPTVEEFIACVTGMIENT